MLYDLAGRGVSNLLTPDSLDARSLILQGEQIAQSLLFELNASGREVSPCSPKNLLRQWLGYRLDNPERAPRLYEFAAKECNHKDYLLWAERVYASPLSFCTKPELAKEQFMSVEGLLHGDLHPRNVLLDRSRPESKDFWLIDFALSFEGPLGYDQAYFELAILLRHLHAATPERLHRLLEAIEGRTAAVPPEDYGIYSCINQMRLQIDAWQLQHYPKAVDSVQSQFMLARVAASLAWVNKPIDDELRRIAFRYGSWTATNYLKRFFADTWTQLATTAEKAGPMADLEGVSEELWAHIRPAVGNFDSRAAKFVVAAGRLNKGTDSRCLGLLPWSAVIDFDPNSDRDGLYSVVEPVLANLRPVGLFGQEPLPVDYDRGTGWLMAGGWNKSSEVIPPSAEWDWIYPPYIRSILESLQKVRPSQPVYIVVLADTIPADYVPLLLQECYVTLQSYANIVVLSKILSQSRHIKHLFDLGVDEFLHLIRSNYGSNVDIESPQIPGKRGAVNIPTKDLRHMEDDFEILHSRVLEFDAQENRPPQDDFWRGNPPTFADLEAGVPLQRPAHYEELKAKVVKPLEEAPNKTIILTHGPGAGGTTLSLQLGWEMRTYYPTVILRRYSKSTVDRLDHLFHLTELPILLIVDSSILAEPDREDLYRAAIQRHLRIVILYVLRATSRRAASDQHVNLPDEMSKQEALAFQRAFSSHTKDVARLRELELIASSDLDEWRVYRSPFFFGLITFQEQYKPIGTYVANCVKGASFPVRKVLRFLALITRYTQNTSHNQAGISESLVAKLLDKSFDVDSSIAVLLGEGAERLVVRHAGILRITHPVLAEQTLKVLIGGDHWKAALKDLGLEFLRELHRCLGANATGSQVLLENLFIRRYDLQSGRGDFNRHFAPLIVACGPPDGSTDGQQEVLAELTKLYPKHGHYWNHRARHLIYGMHQHYEEAIKYIDKAIALDEREMVHYHTKGLIFRFWINDEVEGMFKHGGQPSPEELLSTIRERARDAFDCFETAQARYPNGTYPLVTRVQLTIEIAEQLARSANGDLTIHGLLRDQGPVGEWLEEHLILAEDSLDMLKRLRADTEPSRFESDCESGIERIYGNFDDMVRIWETLLGGTTEELFVRRNLAAAYLSRNGRQWEGMGQSELTRITEMMEKNLASDPTNARDIRTWFQAHRRLPSFSQHGALDRLTKWAKVHESVEAHFYLYVMHFLIWRKSRSPIGEEQILIHSKRCRELATDRGDYCYEWLGREPTWCPLVDHQVLGKLNRRPLPIFQDTSRLQRMSGMTAAFDRQGGIVRLSNRLHAYFVPTDEIYAYKDQQKEINFFLGFSYVGLRAWDVAPGPAPIQAPRPITVAASKAIEGAPGSRPSPVAPQSKEVNSKESLATAVPKKLFAIVAAFPTPMKLSDIGEKLNKEFPYTFKLYREAGFANLTAMISADPRLIIEGAPGQEVVRHRS